MAWTRHSGPGQPRGELRGSKIAWGDAPRRMVWATAGLVAAWAVLTAFSLTAAFSNSRASAAALRDAVVSEQFELVHEALVSQEDAADAVVFEGRAERPAYDDAEAATRAGLADLVGMTDERNEVAVWLGMHARYGQAVHEMFRLAETAPTQQTELFETDEVDPFFDPLESLLRDEAVQHQSRASEALLAMDRSQGALLIATPIVFGAGLLVLLAATTALRRSRRAVAAVAEENRRQALHDPLTGLPNRVMLRERGGQVLEGRSGTGRTALILLDLDGFKEINDRFGHHRGDLVLQQVAERLRDVVRQTDTVARLGGDEFAVLLPDVSDADAAMVVALSVQAALVQPLKVDGLRLTVGASLGLAIADEDGVDLEALLREADAAMYLAKDRGLGISLHDPARCPGLAPDQERGGPSLLV